MFTKIRWWGLVWSISFLACEFLVFFGYSSWSRTPTPRSVSNRSTGWYEDKGRSWPRSWMFCRRPRYCLHLRNKKPLARISLDRWRLIVLEATRKTQSEIVSTKSSRSNFSGKSSAWCTPQGWPRSPARAGSSVSQDSNAETHRSPKTTARTMAFKSRQ